MHEWMTIAEASAYVKVAENTMRRKVNSGDVKATKKFGRWRIRKCDLDDMESNNQNAQAQNAQWRKGKCQNNHSQYIKGVKSGGIDSPRQREESEYSRLLGL